MAPSRTHKEACVAAAERARERVGDEEGKGSLRVTVSKLSLTLSNGKVWSR